MLESASKGRLSIHHADIMKFYIPDAFPKANAVKWESDGMLILRLTFLNKILISYNVSSSNWMMTMYG